MAKATDTTSDEIPEDPESAPGDAAPGEAPETEPAAEPAPSQYRIVRGVNYPAADGNEKRAEPGALVDDLPETSVGWLLDDGAIEKA